MKLSCLLTRLDSRLLKDDQYIFVGYDELDTLGAKNWEILSAAVRGLVAFGPRIPEDGSGFGRKYFCARTCSRGMLLKADLIWLRLQPIEWSWSGLTRI